MKLARHIAFARHVRLAQIAARLRLAAKRQLLSRAPVFGPLFDRGAPRHPMRLAAAPPPPALPPRGIGRPVGGDILAVDLLNREYRLQPPVDWHPAALESGTRLDKLNLHYMEYLEDCDDRLFESLVTDWIEANPRYRRGYWRDNWSSYALSIRTVVWMQQLAQRRPRLPDAFIDGIAESLHGQIRFLARNLELDIRGNHLIKNIKALLWGARFFEGAEAAHWERRALALMRVELDEQILPDGFHFERSPAYHCQVFADLMELFTLLRAGRDKERLLEILRAMAGAIADTTHGDGRCALFNDGGLAMAYAPATLAAAFTRATGEDWPDPRTRFAFPDGGLFGAREAKAYLIVDCGPIGPDQLMGHAHGDILSFELSWAAQRLVVDPGVYEYSPGSRRAYGRATSSHNTVAVAGEDQADFFGAFRVGRRGRGRVLESDLAPGRPFVLAGTHDGYDHLPGAPRHQRRFRFGGTSLEIVDRLTGGRGQTARGRLLLHPACKIDRIAPDRIAIAAPGVSLDLVSSGATLAIGRATYSPDFGVWDETACVDLDFGRLPAENRLTLTIVPA